MSVKFYFDVHIFGPAYEQLRARQIDVLRAQDDNHDAATDPELLNRATELGRVLVTFDQDFLAEAHRRQRSGSHFAGVIFGHEVHVSIGQLVADLALIAECLQPDELENQVFFLPL